MAYNRKTNGTQGVPDEFDSTIRHALKEIEPSNGTVDQLIEYAVVEMERTHRVYRAKTNRSETSRSKAIRKHQPLKFISAVAILILVAVLALPSSLNSFQEPAYAIDAANVSEIPLESLSLVGTTQADGRTYAIYYLVIVWDDESADHVEYRSANNNLHLSHKGQTAKRSYTAQPNTKSRQEQSTAHEEELIRVDGQEAIELAVSIELESDTSSMSLTEIDALAKETLNEKEIRVVAFSEDGSTQEKTVSFTQHT